MSRDWLVQELEIWVCMGVLSGDGSWHMPDHPFLDMPGLTNGGGDKASPRLKCRP